MMPPRVLRELLRLLLPLMFAAVAVAAPQEPLSLPVHRLPLAGALSQNSVPSMLQDRSGLMWFATQDSVNVYDGYSFRVLSADPRDPNALSGVLVSRLFEDRDGQIWISGSLGWLDRLDPHTGTIRHFPRKLYGPPDGPGSFLNTGFYQGPDGILWIGTSQGLHRYDPANDKLVMNADAVGGHVPLLNIRDIVPAGHGRLWLATTTGLVRFDPATHAIEQFSSNPQDPRTLPGDRVSRLHLDPDGTLWIGTQTGLARWDGEGRGFTRFVHDPANPHSLGGNWVTDILRDRAGRLWVSGQQGGGVSLFADGQFQVFLNDKDDQDSISLNDVWTLFEDRSGLIWIGTAGGGLNQLNPSTHRFHSLRAIPFNKNSLASGFVWGIDEDAEHHMWMATLAGLERYQPQDGLYALYQVTPGDVPTNQLQAVHIDRGGRFWVGAVDGRLYRFDPVSGRFTLIHNPDRTDDRFSGNGDRIWHFSEDADGRIWVSTTTELVVLDPQTATVVERVPSSARVPLAAAPIRASLVDSDGTLWLGGAGAGLIRYQRGKGVTAVLGHDPDDPHSLSDIGVRSLYESADGDLWVGTQNGLNRMSSADRHLGRNRFRLYTVAEGLPDNTVYGILPDRNGHLWLSTNRGLSQFDLASGAVQNFDSHDGLVTDEMNGGAERVASDGTFYFGGVNGVSWFRPGEIPRNAYVPPVRVTEVQVAGKSLAGVLTSPSKKVDVAYNENTIALAFAAMDFHQPAKNRFRYRLVGESDAWTETSSNSVNLAKLADGAYRFEVLGSNNDGVWSTAPASLDIVVHPPWWRSSLAYVFYALVLAGLVVFYDLVQRRKLRREREFSDSIASAHSLAEANHQMALRYAQFDNLTQLPNRASLLEALGRYMRFARVQQRQMALLLINLDRFQRINDTLGHNLGDQVLKVTAECLQKANVGDDYLARVGSDEFALIALRPIDAAEDAWLAELGSRIASAIGEPHFEHDPPITMTSTIGIALSKDGVDTPSDLLGYANIALHAAKREGGKRQRRYVPGMIEKARERLGIESRIRKALEAGEFIPWYQPIIDLRRDRIAGFEALIRWQPPGQRMIFPDQFIPVAEESGLIVEMGDFMIREACRQLALWGRRDIRIAVNVSLRQLRSGTLVSTISDALRQSGVPAQCLKVEITESSMMENVGDTAEQLRELKKLGLDISIDDFGTGFSSMGHLKMLPVDEMKIDRSFVSDVASSPHSQKIVNSIVRLAHELQLVVVAEGVEDEHSLAYLRSINCDYAQGYYFGKPKPAEPNLTMEWPMPMRVVA
jgi:diguanylate cyclase (GGDEF)-like protein